MNSRISSSRWLIKLAFAAYCIGAILMWLAAWLLDAGDTTAFLLCALAGMVAFACGACLFVIYVAEVDVDV